MEEDGDDIPDIFRKDCDSPTGKKGLGDKRCMLVGVVVLVFIMCGAVIAIFMHRFTGKGEGWEGRGWGGREGVGRGGEERVGRQAMHACGSCGPGVHHVWSRHRYLHAQIHR